MKITLTKTQHAEITQLRGELAVILKGLASNAAEIDRLNELEQDLKLEITTLEKANSESECDATKLAAKRVQLERVSQKIQSFDSEVGSRSRSDEVQKRVAIQILLKKFAGVAIVATGDVVEAYAKEVASKIRPFCQDDQFARGMAYTLPAVKHLAQTYSRRFGTLVVTIPEIRDAIARADEILSGNLSWTFDSKQ